MKILVTLKRVPDPEQKVKFKGNQLDFSGASWVMNTFDEYAVETALRLNENAATGERLGEVVVASIGPKEASQQLRSALAMGADRAILIAGDDAQLDSGMVARMVAKLTEREKPDLLLMGKQTPDGENNQVGQLVAGFLGWPQATFAGSIEAADGGKALVVGREVDAGMESKKVPLPALVTVDLRIILPRAVHNGATPADHAYEEGPRYASLKGIMAAKKKELKEMTPADLGVEAALCVQVTSVEAPPARKAGVKVKDVKELVEKLHNQAKVI
ncbi:MAG TPA: electron transfer flavoprotein subunit beta/FixA family protein [Polyangia bacterium]|nr:electron transfer flavoprotein subunit beta/FixA family protein [Polyangia bacterium]